MSHSDFFQKYNYIENKKTFDISAFISAYYYSAKPYFKPCWEKYEFSQIFYVLEGTGTYKTEHGTYAFGPGMMFYRPAHQKSFYEWTSQHVRFALVSFVCDSIAMEEFGEKPFILYDEESKTLLDLIKTTTRICDPTKNFDPKFGLILKPDVPDVVLGFLYSSMERFLSIVYCRLKNIDLLLNESQKLNQFMHESKLIAEVKRYLSDNVSKQLTINEICTHFGISQTALMKKFHKETNQGIMEYFTNLKIREARYKIKKTSLSFTEIAEQLGFSSPNYFSKVFKAKTGMTPTEYSKHASKRQTSSIF